MSGRYLYFMVTGTVLLGCAGCGPSYHDRIIATSASSEWIATYFFREPTSALDDNATYISTRAAGTPDDNTTHGGGVLEMRGEVKLGLEWNDNHHLTISCAGCSHNDIDFQVVKVHDLEISYVGFVDKPGAPS
jgi:hypothetical protein